MTDRISHRGPDGDGYWINDKESAGFGHRRLSIIDLSDEGGQPMHYMDGRYTLTFNGEIYNYIEIRSELEAKGYSFKSSSDTEVLLALYHDKQEKCLSDLDGMFAFAIWDAKEEKLFCARDRFGEKPFYYAVHQRGLYFASEMKALWAAGVPRSINHRLVFNYLEHGATFDPGDASATFFNGIQKLPASHFFVVMPDRVAPEPIRYWDLDHTKIDSAINEDLAVERFRELFVRSVERRLRSDVPVGSSLSGGLDSSVVVYVIDELTRGKNSKQSTFSARFPGFAKDEGKYMDIVAAQTNAEPHFVFPNENGLIDDLDTMLYHQEEPVGSASIYAQYCVMRLAKENDTTVLLDGQGADEILAGYHYYFSDYLRELGTVDSSKLTKEKNAHLAFQNGSHENGINLSSNKHRQLVGLLPERAENRLRTLRNHFRQQLRPLFSTAFYGQYGGQSFLRNVKKAKTLSQSLWRSTSGGSLEELLRYADRNSMAHSREVRLPFLCHELVEFVFSLPPDLKIRRGETKYILRTAFSDLLAEEIRNRRDKIGYEPPQAKWLDDKRISERVAGATTTLKGEGILHRRVDHSVQSSEMSWRILALGHLLDG